MTRRPTRFRASARALGLAAGLACLACGPVASEPAPSERSGTTAAPTATTTPDRLVLMTLNAHFLWDGEDPEDGDVDFPWKGSPAEAARHMAEIADLVRAEDPDLVQLIEVEDERTLRTLRDRHLADAGYRVYFVEGTDTATGQDVAVLSRLEFLTFGRDPRRGRSGTERKAVSKHYVASLDVGDLRLGLVGLHLLAGPTRDNRRHPRQAQADAIRTMAHQMVSRGRSVIVWGDFNDYDGETLDRAGNRPITEVLAMIRELDPATDADDLWNVAERLPRDQRFTHYGRGRPAIDHVLLSPDLVPLVDDVRIVHRRDREGPTPHAPIVVTLRVPVR